MTHDEIISMEAGEEMDRLVAEKVMKIKPYRTELCESYVHPYSRCLHWAWVVVENMPAFRIENDYEGEEGGLTKLWHAQVLREQGGWVWNEAPTAPLAICRAALLAVMEKA